MNWYDPKICLPYTGDSSTSHDVLVKYKDERDSYCYFGIGFFNYDDNKWEIYNFLDDDSEDDTYVKFRFEILKWTSKRIN